MLVKQPLLVCSQECLILTVNHLVKLVGDIKIYGHDSKVDLQAIRQMIGYCPQFDYLYPDLTGNILNKHY